MTHKRSPTRLLPCIPAIGLLLCAAHARGQTNTGHLPEGLSTSDWSNIRAVYESNRHAAVATRDGYQAHNPGQHWLTRFDGRGVRTQPDAGGWTWGLELERYGFAGAEREVCEPVQVSAHDQRVAYDWDAVLREWWVNDARGLEHGYTVRSRPPQCETGPLCFTLALRGDLIPRVNEDGRGVRFSNLDGTDVLTYAGLVVLDADGQSLPARFERSAPTELRLSPTALRLSIDERGARYPLTIDPALQQAYLKASNTDASDGFGSALSVSGNTVVVGAPGEASNAVGVNGNQADDSASFAGAVYVFVRSGTTWSQQAYIKASNTEAGDGFGVSVSISGDTLVVGARLEDSNAIGVNGNQADNSAGNAGAAYVFTRSGTTWSQQAYIKASNAGVSDQFGTSVSMSGDTVVVGAEREGSNAVGVNGNQADNSADGAGAAYIFVRSGTTWSQQAYLKASNTGGLDLFGGSVSVSGNTVVVGAQDEDSNATGVNGNQADNSASAAGAVYVFTRNATTWSQQAYIKASNADANDQFGCSVSVSGDTVVVGSFNESSNAIGVNGNQADNSAGSAGAAYVFTRSGTSWSQQAYLKASNTDADDIFGYSVSVSGNTVVVGAQHESSNATGVNGDQSDDSAQSSGAAYVFVRSGTTWSQQTYLKGSNTETGDYFGLSVSVAGNTVVVGAIREASNATGVNGNQANNSSATAGAAYVFDLGTAATPLCFGDGSITTCPCGNPSTAPGRGCNNSSGTGGALISGSGTASLGEDTLVFTTAGEKPTATSIVLQGGGVTPLGAVFGQGLRCFSSTLKRLYLKNAVAGSITAPTSADPSVSARSAALGDTIPAAHHRYYMVYYRDPIVLGGCPSASTFNGTNALDVVWAP